LMITLNDGVGVGVTGVGVGVGVAGVGVGVGVAGVGVGVGVGTTAGMQVFKALAGGANNGKGDGLGEQEVAVGQSCMETVVPVVEPFSSIWGCPSFRSAKRPASSASLVSYTRASRRFVKVTPVSLVNELAGAAYRATASAPFCNELSLKVWSTPATPALPIV